MAAGPLGPSAYALPSDLFGVGGYLRDPSATANSTIATTLLNAASRFIDEKCGRSFFDDGTYTRYFSSDLVGRGDAGQVQITLDRDFYIPTPSSGFVLKFAYYENQPVANWLTQAGDGLTPGATNFFVWPDNPKTYVTTGSVVTAPYQGISMAKIPQVGSTFLPYPMPGTATISLAAGWGWKAVPDLIKDLTLKLAARAYESRQSGFNQRAGSSDFSVGNMGHHFDSRDESLLLESGLVRWAFGT